MREIIPSRITRCFLSQQIMPGNAKKFCRSCGVALFVTSVIVILSAQVSTAAAFNYFFKHHHSSGCCPIPLFNSSLNYYLTDISHSDPDIKAYSIQHSYDKEIECEVIGYAPVIDHQRITIDNTHLPINITPTKSHTLSKDCVRAKINCVFTAPITLDRNCEMRSYFEPHGLSF